MVLEECPDLQTSKSGHLRFESALIVLCVYLEIRLRMEADRTNVRGFDTDDDVTAVAALPNANATLAEDLG